MKAIIQTKYGPLDNNKIGEVEKPIPGDGEVLIEVHASCVNYANVGIALGKPFMIRMWSGFRKPKFRIPGGDLAGKIVAIGKNVNQFKVGDEVYGDTGDGNFGAYGEYVCAPEKNIFLKPSNMTFQDAAAVPQAAVVALQGLRDAGKIGPGKKVLIYGASGGIGTYAVQIAKSFGTEVTGVCSTRNIELVKSLGADYIIDYKKEDFTKNEKSYDLILATAGYIPLTHYKKALSEKGIYVSAGGKMKQIMQALFFGSLLSKKNGKKIIALSHKDSQKDLEFIKNLIEAGKVKSVIDKVYNLEDIAEAFKYYAEGHTKGKIVIAVKEKYYFKKEF